MTPNLSLETVKAQKYWNDVFWTLQVYNQSLRLLYAMEEGDKSEHNRMVHMY